jgi:hypothetical protein
MRMVEFVVTSLLAQALGFELQEYRPVHLRKREDAQSKYHESPDRLDILCPPPSEMRVYHKS